MEHMKAHQKHTHHNIDLIRSLYRPLSLSLSLCHSFILIACFLFYLLELTNKTYQITTKYQQQTPFSWL